MRLHLWMATVLVAGCLAGDDEGPLGLPYEELGAPIEAASCTEDDAVCSGSGHVYTSLYRVGNDGARSSDVAQTFTVPFRSRASSLRLKLRLLRPLTWGENPLVRVRLVEAPGGVVSLEAADLATGERFAYGLSREVPTDVDIALSATGELLPATTYAFIVTIDAPLAGAVHVGVASHKSSTIAAQTASMRWIEGRPFSTAAGDYDLSFALALVPSSTSWAAGGGGTTRDEGRAVAVDADGNVYVAGTFSGTATFGSTTLTSSGGEDLFVGKLDPSGNWLWARRAGGTGDDAAMGVAVDAGGNPIVTGYFRGSAAFGTTTLTAAGTNPDAFVARLDTSGNWLWTRQIGGTGYAEGAAVAVDSNGGLYVSGGFYGSATFGATTLTSAGDRDVFVARLDASGAWQWVRQAGGASGDWAHGLAVNGSGTVWVTGYFIGTSTFGGGSVTATGGTDIFVATLNASGTWQWVRRGGSTSGDSAWAVAADAAGNAYVTGRFRLTASFGSKSVSVQSHDEELFVAKVNASGTWQWALRAGGVSALYPYGVAVDAAGDAYVTGATYNVSTFGATTVTPAGSVDAFVAKVAPSGAWTWARAAGGSSSDWGYGIAVRGEALYVTGYAGGTATFGAAAITAAGGVDVFVAKLGTSGEW